MGNLCPFAGFSSGKLLISKKCMCIRTKGIEKGTDCSLFERLTSWSDGFIGHNGLNCVTWITLFLKLRPGCIVCGMSGEYSCLELGKVLVICKKWLKACQAIQDHFGQTNRPIRVLPKFSYAFCLFVFITGFFRRHHGVRPGRIK